MLEMALVGYQHEREKIAGIIEDLRARLKESAAAPAKTAGKRVMNPAARRRIAAAQKKRWAEHRKRLAAAGK